MIRKITLTLLSSLFWAPYAFAMIEQDMDESAKTRHQHAPIIKLEELTESMRKNQLVLFMLERRFEEAQCYCLDKSNSTTGLASQLFWDANVICSNDASIQNNFPAHLKKLAPYLEADILQDRPTHIEQAIQEEDPLTKLQNHPLIRSIASRDYDAAQFYCEKAAKDAKSAGNLAICALFTEGGQILSKGTLSIQQALPTFLQKLAPHLKEENVQPDPVSPPRLPMNYQEFAKRIREEADAHMGTEFTINFARTIQENSNIVHEPT